MKICWRNVWNRPAIIMDVVWMNEIISYNLQYKKEKKKKKRLNNINF